MDAGQLAHSTAEGFRKLSDGHGLIDFEQGQLLLEAAPAFATHAEFVEWAIDELHISRSTISRLEAYASQEPTHEWTRLGVNRAYAVLRALKRDPDADFHELQTMAYELSVSDFAIAYLGAQEKAPRATTEPQDCDSCEYKLAVQKHPCTCDDITQPCTCGAFDAD